MAAKPALAQAGVTSATPSAADAPTTDPAVVLKPGQHIPNAKYAYTGSVRPIYPLSDKRTVPAHIPRPDYVDDRESRSSGPSDGHETLMPYVSQSGFS